MMITLIVRDDFATYCFLWTPTITCETCLAVMLPHRFFVNYLDVICRTNSRTSSTAVAFLVGLKALVSNGYEFREGEM